MRAALLLAVLVALALSGCGADEPARDTDTGAGPAPAERTVDASDAPEGDFFSLEEIGSDFDQPLGLVPEPGSGELWVLEQGGRVVNLTREQTLIDLTDRVRSGGEQGLLGLAFHPDYDRNGRLFVHYTNTEGDTRVDEYRARDGVVDPSSRRELLAVEQPYPNHNGGELSFGPDGLLYLGLGDGGGAYDEDDRAQDLEQRLGKLLRIDVDAEGSDWEIAAYGLRNPWRFSWDRETGVLWIGDVGQDEVEEIDAIAELPDTPPNFGWPAFEGTSELDEREPEGPGELIAPVAEYDHDEGCSIAGGHVYRGREVPRLRGRYVFGDLCSGTLWTVRAERASASDPRREEETVEQLASFATDLDGELYAVALDGRVFRLRGSELGEGR